MRPKDHALLTLALAALAPSLPAQEWLWERGSVFEVYTPVGHEARLGDVNGDGYDDLMTGVVWHLGPGNSRGQLWVLSGKDGSTLRIRGEPDPAAGYRNWVRAGDMDRDGTPDYAVTLGDPTGWRMIVQVCSGSDDRVIWSHQRPAPTGYGAALAGDLDLDGDGRPDLLVADYDQAGLGPVHAYSNSGALLYSFNSPPAYGLWPSLAKVGDVDGDGADEWVVGAGDPYGLILLVSGRTGAVLRSGRGERYGDYIGYSVAGLGDLDGDGIPDFAAGNSDFFSARGVVRAFSGATAEPLHTWTARNSHPQDGFGTTLAGGQDLDRDGVPDIVVGAPREYSEVRTGFTYVFSGRDGSEIYRLPLVPGILGPHLAMLPPQPGHSFGVFAASVAGSGGRVVCYRGSPPSVEVFGASGRGTLASFPRIGLRDLGPAGVRVHVSGAEPGQPVGLVLGGSRTTYHGLPLGEPLYFHGMPGCLRFVSIDAILWTTAGTTGNARGYASIDLALRVNPAGRPIFTQWLCLGAGPTAPGGVSDALTWRF